MELLNLVFLALAVLAMPFARPEDLTGRVSYGLFSAIGSSLKPIGRAALPIVGGIIGGPAGAAIGSAVAGALGGGGTDTASRIGQIAGAALPAITALRGSRQASRDSAAARALTQQAVGLAAQNAQRAQQEFAMGAPLRQQFRSGAMSFGDPTNPFTRAMGGGPGAPPPEIPPEIMSRVQATMGQIAQTMKSGGSISGSARKADYREKRM